MVKTRVTWDMKPVQKVVPSKKKKLLSKEHLKDAKDLRN